MARTHGGTRLDSAGFAQRHGVAPEQFADYLALVGDKIDDIPGVPGVGPKTAAALCAAFGSLGGIQQNLGNIAELEIRGANKLGDKLSRHWQQVELARRLTGLEDRIPDIHTLPRAAIGAEQLTLLAEFLQALGLSGPLVGRCRRFAEGLAK